MDLQAWRIFCLMATVGFIGLRFVVRDGPSKNALLFAALTFALISAALLLVVP